FRNALKYAACASLPIVADARSSACTSTSSVICASKALSSPFSSASSAARTTAVWSGPSGEASTICGGGGRGGAAGGGGAGRLFRAGPEHRLGDRDVEVDVCVRDRAVVVRPEQRDAFDRDRLVGPRHAHPGARLGA